MPKYEVEMKYIMRESCAIEVESVDKDEAKDFAIEQLMETFEDADEVTFVSVTEVK